MNFCIINGHKVFPALGKSIKITKENPLIKDRDAQTMEIEFPLAIYSNRKFFGNLNRIDVAKHSIEYKDCILYARNPTGSLLTTPALPDRVAGKRRQSFLSD